VEGIEEGRKEEREEKKERGGMVDGGAREGVSSKVTGLRPRHL
jgi:hypothetical protein